MKKVKTIVNTLLFSAFMTVVVSTAGYKAKLTGNQDDNTISVCSEECPSFSSIESGY